MLKYTYTVKELIEALQQCPQDYEVTISINLQRISYYDIDTVAINHEDKTVDISSN